MQFCSSLCYLVKESLEQIWQPCSHLMQNSTTESVRNTSRIAFNATAFNMSSVIDLAMQVWQHWISKQFVLARVKHNWNCWNLCEHPKRSPQKKKNGWTLAKYWQCLDCWRKISSHDYSHFHQDEWACGSGRQRLTVYIYIYGHRPPQALHFVGPKGDKHIFTYQCNMKWWKNHRKTHIKCMMPVPSSQSWVAIILGLFFF